MSEYHVLFAQAVFIAIVTLVMCVFGLACLWATNRRASYLARLAPISILAASLLPLGMLDYAVLMCFQAAYVCGFIGIERLARSWRSKRLENQQVQVVDVEPIGRRGWSWPRFQLVDLFKAFMLSAILLSLASYFPGEWEHNYLGNRGFVGIVLLLGAIMAFLTLLGGYLAIASRRWALLGITGLTLIGVGTATVSRQSELLSFFVPTVLASCGQILLTAGWLRLLSAARWDWWKPRKPVLSSDDSNVSMPSPTPRANRTLVARTALMIVSFVCLLPLANLYWAIIPPAMPVASLPEPNGYDELVKASDQLDWKAIPQQDSDAANDAQCQQFAQDNAAVFELAREALTLPSAVPREHHSSAMRDLCQAFWLEARAHKASGQPTDAMNSYLDAIRLAAAISRGGIAIDEFVAEVIAGGSVSGLANLLDDLDDPALEMLIRASQARLTTRESLADIQARTQIYHQLEFGWQGRLYNWFLNWGLDILGDEETLPSLIARGDASLQLLILEAALRRHELAQGKPADSLEELVPHYLSTLPTDPFSGQPFHYRRTNGGQVLYSVGHNRTDDGGVGPSKDDRTTGDLLLLPSP